MMQASENPESSRQVGYRAAQGIAAVAFVFTLVVSVLIALSFLQVSAADPIDSKSLERLRTELKDSPDPESTSREIRTLDLWARKAYFTSVGFRRTGAYLLLGGVVVLLIALKVLVALNPKKTVPGRRPDMEEGEEHRARARFAVAGLGGGLAIASILLIFLLPKTEIPSPEKPEGTKETPPPKEAVELGALPKREEILKNWPAFRGPEGNGIAYGTTPPLTWDAASGKNILWKVEVPRHGYASPILWGEKVFLTGADADVREIFCFDAGDGRLVWRTPVEGIPGSPAKPPPVTEDTGLAAPTMTTDGRLIFAIFGTGDVIGLTFDGKKVWGRNLGVPKNPYGHASSLITHKNRLFLQFDDEKRGRLLALNSETGETLWETPRKVNPSWASPIVVNTGERIELILNASPLVVSHDPETGGTLWEKACMDGEVAPSPAFAGGMVFAVNANACLAAIHIATGKIVWEAYDDLPEVASPLATGLYLIVASSDGLITCFDAATGKDYWFQEYDNGFYASPILAGDRVYATDMSGVTHVFEPDKTYRLLGTGKIGEKVTTTPAFKNGRIFLRGDKHLFCIGKRDE
jgi:outer membrane protein assembly factor BamB